MMQESKHLASLINVPPKTIYDIFKSPTDWEFILKIDALPPQPPPRITTAAVNQASRRSEDLLS
jgi:hypothetical protein